MVNYIVNSEHAYLTENSIITKEEADWILNSFNKTVSFSPIEKSVIHIFEEVVRKYGENTALSWNGRTLSYRELNVKANRLAERISAKGVKRGDKVAILLEQGPVQIVSILAILKSGGAYVPVDAKYPEEHIAFMLEDSEAKLVITCKNQIKKIRNVSYLLSDGIILTSDFKEGCTIECSCTPPELCGDDEAYVIYTSGSTGKPKGVVLCHKGIIRTVKGANYLNMDHTDRQTQMASYTFDMSVWEIFSALLNGATLIMVPREAVLEVPELARLLMEEQVTSVLFVTSVFNMLVDYDAKALNSIRSIYIGGEALSAKHVHKAVKCLGAGRLMNLYGPTETTMCVTYYPIDSISLDAASVPIGRPISNAVLYVLDEQGNLLPPNVPGELCIGGCGVSKGYLNKPELNAEKFVNVHFESSERVYRSGDRAMLTSDGELLFLGRMDNQIKLHGFRIELGEVEKRISMVEGIKEAVVVASKDDLQRTYMAAYYTVVDGIECKPEQVIAALQKQVPEYMIPSQLMCLEQFPLTQNGKVDRKALVNISKKEYNVGSSVEKPNNKAERVLLEAMRKAMNNSNLGLGDNFFKNGCQSIQAIAFTQILREQGIEMKISDVFNRPTVEKLAKLPGLSVLAESDGK